MKIFVLALIVSILFTINSFAKTPPNNLILMQGKVLFENNCKSCHNTNIKLDELNNNSSLDSINEFLNKHKIKNIKKNLSDKDLLKISVFLKRKFDKKID